MAKLDELFEVRTGIASSRITLLQRRIVQAIPFIRPSKTQLRTIAGWVNRESVPKEHRYPKHSIFVSTNGEGSHTYAYVSDFEFTANSDVSILIPKRPMGLTEKIFYAKAITLNRNKFSYGRKPKGARLKSIDLPDLPPTWVTGHIVSNPSINLDVLLSKKISRKRNTHTSQSNTVDLDELFEVIYGTNLELNQMTENPNGINFVARTSQNNGVSAKVQRLYNVAPIHGMVLTVAGGGSVLETFLQIASFYSGRDLYYLRPKLEMSADEMLYYATCIRANQYRYSYGRQANKTLRNLKIPALDAIPSWVNGTLNRVVEQLSS